jgi:RNA polymerase sigma factor (sigma-70 family)
MPRRSEIPPDSLDQILAWLDPDREVAASIYLALREDLFRIFNWAGCSDPEGLTDEAFDRVGGKLHEVPDYQGDPKHYLHAFARNLIKEDRKRIKKEASLEGIDPEAPQTGEFEAETAERRHECLESCLEDLSPEQRELIKNYYAKEKQAKIDHRAQLADKLGVTLDALRVRVHRLRGKLEKCVERCLDEKAKAQ